MAETNGIFISSGGGGSNSAPIEDWIADYKTWVEKSYVYNTAEIWQSVIDSELSMQDSLLGGKILDVTNVSTSRLSVCEGLTKSALIKQKTTFSQVLDDSTLRSDVFNSKNAMQAISYSNIAMQTIVNSSTYFNSLIANENALSCVLNSSLACKIMIGNSTCRSTIINNSTLVKKVLSSDKAICEIALNNDACKEFTDVSQTYRSDIYTAMENSKIVKSTRINAPTVNNHEYNELEFKTEVYPYVYVPILVKSNSSTIYLYLYDQYSMKLRVNIKSSSGSDLPINTGVFFRGFRQDSNSSGGTPYVVMRYEPDISKIVYQL